MKKSLVWSLVMLFVLAMSVSAQAALTTIGTAQFGGSSTEYKLIWDDDNNGNSLVWLDYSHTGASWTSQNTWAAGLDDALTIHLYSGYSVDWDGSWRLPNAAGPGETPTVGYNMTTSEMGHLYYTELGNVGQPEPGWGLNNTGDFDNLSGYQTTSAYWTSTAHETIKNYGWYFLMYDGYLSYNPNSRYYYGLAVRTGDVLTSSVPLPGAIWLLGSGLVGLVGFSRRKKQI